jgi:hypothetical protein
VSDAHRFVSLLALLLVLVATAWSVIGALMRRQPGAFLLANLVWVALATAIAGLLGILVALTSSPPRDVLHIVYGLLALAVPVGGAVLVGSRPEGQRPAVMAITSVVALILVARLFQTGG